MTTIQDKIMVGCGKVINPHRVCGDISFTNEIILCEDCQAKQDDLYMEGER